MYLCGLDIFVFSIHEWRSQDLTHKYEKREYISKHVFTNIFFYKSPLGEKGTSWKRSCFQKLQKVVLPLLWKLFNFVKISGLDSFVLSPNDWRIQHLPHNVRKDVWHCLLKEKQNTPKRVFFTETAKSWFCHFHGDCCISKIFPISISNEVCLQKHVWRSKSELSQSQFFLNFICILMKHECFLCVSF